MVVLQTMLEFCGQPPARDAGISQEDLKQSYDRLRAKDYARPDRMTEGTRLPLWVITNDGEAYLRTLVDRMMRAEAHRHLRRCVSHIQSVTHTLYASACSCTETSFRFSDTTFSLQRPNACCIMGAFDSNLKGKQTMTPELSKTIDKVRKLLALAGGSNNENEVQAAAIAADAIMQEHRITRAMLEAAGDTAAEALVTRIVSEGGRRTAWRETLLWALCAHYGCAWYLHSQRVGGQDHTRGRKGSSGRQYYTVVGTESDTQIVEYMFKHLTDEVLRLSRWHAGGKGVKYAASWQMGCAKGIHKQFHDRLESARVRVAQEISGGRDTSTALVILDKRASAADEELKRLLGGKVGTAANITGGTDLIAQLDGFVVGKDIQIREGLAEGTHTPALPA